MAEDNAEETIMKKYLYNICEKEIEMERIHYISDGIGVNRIEKKEKGPFLFLAIHSTNIKEICSVCYDIISEKVSVSQKEISSFVDQLVIKKGNR